MDEILVIKVLENLSLSSPFRVIGWETEIEKAIKGMYEFGSECKWSYAVIEKVKRGVHQINTERIWFKYDEKSCIWHVLDKEEAKILNLSCNHTIG
jgi:hypothetical protein